MSNFTQTVYVFPQAVLWEFGSASPESPACVNPPPR